MTTVELAPAYCWDCPECGRENFQRCVSVRLDPSNDGDAEVIRDMHGLSEGEPIPSSLRPCMQTRPDRVSCRHCGAEFIAADCGIEDDDSDDEDGST